jgi:hypothetical protein
MVSIRWYPSDGIHYMVSIRWYPLDGIHSSKLYYFNTTINAMNIACLKKKLLASNLPADFLRIVVLSKHGTSSSASEFSG